MYRLAYRRDIAARRVRACCIISGMSSLRPWFVAILWGAVAAPLLAQPSPVFGAASVKAVEDARTWAVRNVDSQLYRSVSNVMQTLTWAWKVKNYQVAGAPGWLGQERFEIAATIPASSGKPVSDDEVRLMMQVLLAERFGLKLHRETREIAVYALVTGKNAPNLTESPLGAPAEGRGVNIVSGKLIARDATMGELVDVLTTNLDRPVIDETNLTAHYDFDLSWDRPDVAATGWEPIGPAIFTPIQSLGLRLEARRAAVEMLVIDSVSRPSAN